ncbi:glycosyltransferase family 25 protein [Acinetobacter lactucae]|uniref:glycosyltransferase family 25 protein n=1 Tax=Acinetobacter lactucae TaxID=1785128 RepID=UPI00148CA683|nr:glycosyltransferase family 25 protein [Acinetobacter lactucae]EKU4700227.1 glycosyltransferase family 25 protein [Acinetobacter baumannii]
MKIYVVTIEDEKSPRLSKFLNQNFFEQGNLPITKIGIKGGELSAKEYFEKAVKGRSKPLTPAELGCTLSHLLALEKFLETSEQFALIFEDDAILPVELNLRDLETELKNFNLPQNILFSLGGIQMKESLKVRGIIKEKKLFNKGVLEVHPHFYNRVNYAVAYVVDREMAKNLIAYHQLIRKADDWSYLFDFNENSHILMTYLIDHPVINIGEKDTQLSAIEGERVKSFDLPKSRYGESISYNFAKLKYKKYPFNK